MNSNDILVVPEIYGHSIRSLPTGIRQVILNQNIYNTVDLLSKNPRHASPYVDNPDLASVVVVSEDNAEVLKSLFPKISVERLRLGIDPALYHLPSGQKARRIAFMPRKRRFEAGKVIDILKKAQVLEGWQTVGIDNQSEADTAGVLRGSKLFLSFSKQEGFGLPPLEALACGCFVVGYHGMGGREYFDPRFTIAVEDGDVVAFARATEIALKKIDENVRSAAIMESAASRFALDRYTMAQERQNVLSIFAKLTR